MVHNADHEFYPSGDSKRKDDGDFWGGGVTDALKENPTGGLVAIVVLLVLVLMLCFYVYSLKHPKDAAASAKSKFINKYNNLGMNGNSPLWWLGAGDAGWGGSVHRETTPYQAAVYDASLRNGKAALGGDVSNSIGVQEGLVGGRAKSLPIMRQGCAPWSPAAAAEVMAQGGLGNYLHSEAGMQRLQEYVGRSHDASSSRDDDVLALLARGGEAP